MSTPDLNRDVNQDWNQEGTASETKPVGFCQHCGKPLNPETIRVVGPAVYCEPCLAAQLSGAQAAAGGKQSPPPAAATDTVWQWGAGMPPGWTPGTGPNPGLAALLGLIPGVGAMYNEQYAKGIFHLMVFAVLISLSHASGLFGLMAFGWICYMVIEAHHTARARRDGTPLPNPFGLNDLGERLGFGRAWPSAASTVPPAPGAPGAAGPTAHYPPPPVAGPVSAATGYTPPATPWGAPSDGYPAGYNAATGYGTSYGQQPYSSGYGAAVPPIPPFPPTPPYGAPFDPTAPIPGAEAPYVPPPNRFPAGAVWLIGLGTLFLLSTTGIFQVFFGWSLVGFVLIGLAVWIFLRRMLDTGASLVDDGTAGYLPRVVRALGPSVWVFTIGVLLLLDAFHLIPWHRSWPVFIILAGVMALAQRAAYNSAAASYYPPQAPPPASTGTSRGGAGTSLRVQRNDLKSDLKSANDRTDDRTDAHQGGN